LPSGWPASSEIVKEKIKRNLASNVKVNRPNEKSNGSGHWRVSDNQEFYVPSRERPHLEGAYSVGWRIFRIYLAHKNQLYKLQQNMLSKYLDALATVYVNMPKYNLITNINNRFRPTL
jgi:hypothetical protein